MKIQDIFVNYIDYGQPNNDAVLLLHGWGQNIEMMKKLGDSFENTNRVIIVDLPGFGLSEEPKTVWSNYDYVECIKQLVENLKLKNISIIGHSFGGKIGLLYASMYKVKNLVCLASPYKKEIEKENFKVKLLKFAKKIPMLSKLENFAKKHIGSTDYKNASEMMRKILVVHVNNDITEKVKDIKCPTLLIWGTADQAVDIKRAYELEKLIKDCGLVVYQNCTHYAYLERFEQTVNVLNNFIGG